MKTTMGTMFLLFVALLVLALAPAALADEDSGDEGADDSGNEGASDNDTETGDDSGGADAEEAADSSDNSTEASDDENETETGNDDKGAEEESEVDNETSEETESMSSVSGAKVRLLQLEKAITRNIARGEAVIATIQEKNPEASVAGLKSILAELNVLKDEVAALSPEKSTFSSARIDSRPAT